MEMEKPNENRRRNQRLALSLSLSLSALKLRYAWQCAKFCLIEKAFLGRERERDSNLSIFCKNGK